MFPELALAGYPPRTCSSVPASWTRPRRRWPRWRRRWRRRARPCVVGFPERLPRGPSGRARRQQRRADRRRAGDARRAASRCCPPTTCSTSGATSSPRPRSRRVPFRGRHARALDLRGHLERRRLLAAPPLPRRSGRDAGAGRRRDHRQHLGVALHDRRSGTCARACSRRPRRAGSGRCCSSTRWAARTIWCSTARAWRSTRAAR